MAAADILSTHRQNRSVKSLKSALRRRARTLRPIRVAIVTLIASVPAKQASALTCSGTWDTTSIANGSLAGAAPVMGNFSYLYNCLTLFPGTWNSTNVGIGTTSPGRILDVYQSHNGPSAIAITNQTSGMSASSAFAALNDTSNIVEVGIYSSGSTPVGALAAGDSYLYANSAGLNVMANSAGGS